MSRSVELWVGANDDAKIPDRVKLRIWLREDGRCSLTKRKIMAGEPFDYEHRIALCNGGRHAEDNIVLALRGKVHQAKSADDVAIRAKTDRIAKKHAGIKSERRSFWDPKKKRTMDGRVVPR